MGGYGVLQAVCWRMDSELDEAEGEDLGEPGPVARFTGGEGGGGGDVGCDGVFGALYSSVPSKDRRSCCAVRFRDGYPRRGY